MNMNTKGIGTAYRQKLATVITAGKGIITPRMVAESLNVSRQEAGRLLSRWNQQNWVKRIKRGVYIPTTIEDIHGKLAVEEPWVLASRLFEPGYIGGFSAIKHWDFTEQIFETTTFFTTKKIKDRNPIIGITRFYLKTISSYKLFGTKPVWIENTKVLVSDPSKTIIDILDDPPLIGGMRVVKDIFSAYKSSKYFDMNMLITYAEKMKNKTIFKRLGFLLETMGLNEMINKYFLQEKISLGYSIFDPTVKNTSVIRKWNLKVPKNWKNTT